MSDVHNHGSHNHSAKKKPAALPKRAKGEIIIFVLLVAIQGIFISLPFI